MGLPTFSTSEARTEKIYKTCFANQQKFSRKSFFGGIHTDQVIEKLSLDKMKKYKKLDGLGFPEAVFYSPKTPTKNKLCNDITLVCKNEVCRPSFNGHIDSCIGFEKDECKLADYVSEYRHCPTYYTNPRPTPCRCSWHDGVCTQKYPSVTIGGGAFCNPNWNLANLNHVLQHAQFPNISRAKLKKTQEQYFKTESMFTKWMTGLYGFKNHDKLSEDNFEGKYKSMSVWDTTANHCRDSEIYDELVRTKNVPKKYKCIDAKKKFLKTYIGAANKDCIRQCRLDYWPTPTYATQPFTCIEDPKPKTPDPKHKTIKKTTIVLIILIAFLLLCAGVWFWKYGRNFNNRGFYDRKKFGQKGRQRFTQHFVPESSN